MADQYITLVIFTLRREGFAVNPRRRFLALASLVGTVLLTVWWLRRPQGPTYQGRDVRDWLLFAERQYMVATFNGGNRVISVSPQALTAFRAMGTNAIPLLVDAALTTSARPLGGTVLECLDHELPGLTSEIPNAERVWLSSGDLQTFAYYSLEALHPPADLLFPLTTNRLRHSNGDVNDTAMNLLLCVSDDRESVARRLAPLLATEPALVAKLLSRLGPAAVTVLPQLVASLSTSDDEARLETVHCLGAIGPEASNALASLRAVYEAESKPLRRLHIAKDAFEIGASEFWADNDVRGVFAGTNRPLRLEVVRLLSKWTNILPRFELELAALARRTANDRSPDWKESLTCVILDTLYSAKLDRIRMIPLLGDCLQSTNPCVRLNATDKLLQLVPTDALAFASLTNLLSDRSVERVYWYYSYRKVQRRLVDIAAVNGQARSFLRARRSPMPNDFDAEIKDLLRAHPEDP